ncbi:hypothetical protein C4D60_Mb04t23440 [Musa balbisiana]|uniref:Uncharacterized protein n=1 Tax=Musa balbisiana TaxID=52838 RepID=A0A4S8KE45_MUSBA|nr:hypothetical protein C4D60_Mb04t23440 [Musa balbisiana]
MPQLIALPVTLPASITPSSRVLIQSHHQVDYKCCTTNVMKVNSHHNSSAVLTVIKKKKKKKKRYSKISLK